MKNVRLFTAMLLISATGLAQVPMTYTGSYFQNFDNIGSTSVVWTDNSTIPDWWAQRSAGGIFNLVPRTGNTTTGALYNFGLNTGSTDRALGSIGSGTTGHIAWGVQLLNNSGTTITQMVVTYIGEQWRDAGNNPAQPQVVPFYYKTSPSLITDLNPYSNATWTNVLSLNFTSPVYTTTASALDGDVFPNRVFLSDTISGLNIPDGHYIMLKWDDMNHTGGDHGMAVDSVTVAWVVPNTVTAGTIAGSPFCVSSLSGAAVNVPYTISGLYDPGNEFKAYLSDSAGNFANEVEIGSVVSQTADTINAMIPAGTPTGTAYRIRVKATTPAADGSANPADLTVVLDVEDVISMAAAPNYQTATIYFTPPPGCFDEVMLVGKELNPVSAAPTGDGSLYTANSQDFADPLNTVFDGTGKVVYKSAAPVSPVVITGLANGVLHYFKFFTRQGTLWSPGKEVSVTPIVLPNIVITEIMYDDPSTGTTNDTLEFIEFYNNDTLAVDFTDWTVTTLSVNHVFTAGPVVHPGNYLVLAKKASAVDNFFAYTGSVQWNSGSLNNTGALITLSDNVGNVVDSVRYSNLPPWPTSPNGQGPSLTLCDPHSDNSDPANWSASTEFTDSLNHIAVYATPGAGCSISIDSIAPVAIHAYATSLSTVVVEFNELIDQTSAETVAHYTWVTATTATATLYPSADAVELILSAPLLPGIPDTLFVTGISDTAMNVMTMTYTFPIVFGIVPLNLDTLVFWNFPFQPDDQFADGGITPNLTKSIAREPAFTDAYSYPAGFPTYSISTTGWDNGAQTKYWIVEFTTLLYDSIIVSSKQYSSGTAPKDFALEYSLDGVSWVGLPGANIECNSGWLLGDLDKYLLPDMVDNKPSVSLRWIMTTNDAVNGSPVGSGGVARIDEIYVFGRYNPILGVQCQDIENPAAFSMYPNPSSGAVTLRMAASSSAIVTVFNLLGQQVFSESFDGQTLQIDLRRLPAGMYQVSVLDTASGKRANGKIIIQ